MFKIALKVMSKETGKKQKRITLSMKIRWIHVIKLIEIRTSYAVVSEYYEMRDQQCVTSRGIIITIRCTV